ncbi:hypothetical protein D3OALGA1CA_3812 [Olavius algarvensis associated proteobacterium Delta 3]|nr:hypothetical protein D3OALGA1CA_3812 [Olavius algarvensis associated proteobacterium Delta 3]CAB5150424.1 hypothetical protein D3OALGB2SA_4770 [Olavius algarvensis associated proteobacterium Delta 3]
MALFYALHFIQNFSKLRRSALSRAGDDRFSRLREDHENRGR